MNKMTNNFIIKMFADRSHTDATYEDLVEAGADLNYRFPSGSNLLDVACEKKLFWEARILLDLGIRQYMTPNDIRDLFLSNIDGLDLDTLLCENNDGNTYLPDEDAALLRFLVMFDPDKIADLFITRVMGNCPSGALDDFLPDCEQFTTLHDIMSDRDFSWDFLSTTLASVVGQLDPDCKEELLCFMDESDSPFRSLVDIGCSRVKVLEQLYKQELEKERERDCQNSNISFF